MVDFAKYLKKNMPDSMSRPYKVIWNDTETTGTEKEHGLIQWSAKIFIDGVEKDKIDLKIQPFKDDKIEDSALEANHTSKDELFSSDRFTPKVAHQAIVGLCARYVDKFDKKDKFIWKGFNSRFDMDRTRDFFTKLGDTYFGSWFWFPPADIMGLAIHILQRERVRLPDFKQKTVWEYLFPEQKDKYKEEEWHDAMFDIDRCRDIENALRARLQTAIDKAREERDQFQNALKASEESIKELKDKYDTLEAHNKTIESQLADIKLMAQ